MVTSREEGLIKNIRLSSVGPAYATGSDVIHEPSGMDLAMKLHYLTGVYIFRRHAVQGLTTMRIKETMFYWCNEFYVTCGRFRRSEQGRPYLKCNDCGARFVEAQCDLTVDEWLEMRDTSLENMLLHHQAIGPELSFSPPMYIQITWFKCGGMSLGISCSHVLGDAFSVCDFINKFGHYVATSKSNGAPNLTTQPSPVKKEKSKILPALAKPEDPLSIKRVDPVGDHWITPSSCKMNTFSFHLTGPQISQLRSKFSGQTIPVFELVCAIIWQCIAQVRDGSSPNRVTICKRDAQDWKNDQNMSNSQIISVVQVDFPVIEADLEKLAAILADEAVDERTHIEQAMERDNGVPDFIVYGANLTFVNTEDANLYGLELNGEKADFVSYRIQGVGDEGAVLVLEEPKVFDKDGGKGRLVTIILPEDQVLKLKPELNKNGLLLENNLE